MKILIYFQAALTVALDCMLGSPNLIVYYFIGNYCGLLKLLSFLCLCSDPHPPYHGINTSTEDLATRIRNLDVLIHNIKAFYEVRTGTIL